MRNQILFYIVILLTNIIHGITGFAGTILAMPPSLMLVGYDIAKPILNVLAIFSGVYVFVGNYKKIAWKELAKIVVVMALGIFGAVFIKGLFVGKEHLLYKLLGLLVIGLSVQGFYKLVHKPDAKTEPPEEEQGSKGNVGTYALLVLAGIIHGLFVSGGPLLTGYMTKRIKDKIVSVGLPQHPRLPGRCPGGAVGTLHGENAGHLGAVPAGGHVHRQQAGGPHEPAGLYEADLHSVVHFGAFASGEVTPCEKRKPNIYKQEKEKCEGEHYYETS